MNKVSKWLEDRRRSYTAICEPQRARESKECAELVERLVVAAEDTLVAIGTVTYVRNGVFVGEKYRFAEADELKAALVAIQGKGGWGMSEQLPDPPWRVLAWTCREYRLPHQQPTVKWWTFDDGPYALFVDPTGRKIHPKYIHPIDHPRNDPEAVEIIKEAKKEK